jgi:cell division protease FtsH
VSIQKPYSEETGRMIDEEVRILVNACYERSKNLLERNKESLSKIADLLFKKEIIYKEDIDHILGRKLAKDSINSLNEVSVLNHKKKVKRILPV